MIPPVNVEVLNSESEASAEEVRRHLDTLCKSSNFVTSKRCQEFLRYIVLEVVEGRADSIKERNIAHEVFGKGTSFESSEDSLVRVKAREVRKRLSDYYQSAPDDGLRIEIPLGGYVPQIRRSGNPLPEMDTPPSEAICEPAAPLSRRRFAWMLGGTLGALGIATASVSRLVHKHSSPLDLLWRPVFDGTSPLLIFIPIMYLKDGSATEWVGLGPTAILGKATEFLTKHKYPYRLRFGADLNFSQMREQPSLLLGGFYSMWTLMMTRNLRFGPISDDARTDQGFIDRQTNQIWRPTQQSSHPYVDVDYGILCRLFDSSTRQVIMLAVGTRTFGTEGAADALFDPDTFSALLKNAPKDWETKNFQVLFRVPVVGTTISTPQVIATHFW